MKHSKYVLGIGLILFVAALGVTNGNFGFQKTLAAQGQVNSPRHYVIPVQNFELLNPQQRPQIVARNGSLILVRMTPLNVQVLSQTLHEKKTGCGGFVDVEDEMNHYRDTAKVLAFAQYSAPQRPGFAQDLPTVSHPAEVNLLLSKIRQDRFEDDWKQLTAFPNRYSRGEFGAATTQWLRDRMLQWAHDAGRPEISARIIPTGDGYTQNSVGIRIPGANSKLPGVLVGGHFDTYPDLKPGVDDDASGSSSVMEIYRAILDSNLRFNRDIYFFFYAAEEVGLVGSKRVAQDFQNSKIELRGVLQFDMTSYKSKNDQQDMFFITDNTNLPLSTFTRNLAIQYLKMPANSIGTTACGYACSDHASWHRLGYASVFPFESSMHNYNPTIHTKKDDFSLVDIHHAMQFTGLGGAFIVEMAEPLKRGWR